MKSENDLALVRETVRLLEDVPFKDWPTFEAEPAVCVRVDIPLEDPTKPPSPEVAAKLAEFKATLKRIDNDLALQAGHVRVAMEELRQGRTKKRSSGPMPPCVLQFSCASAAKETLSVVSSPHS